MHEFTNTMYNKGCLQADFMFYHPLKNKTVNLHSTYFIRKPVAGHVVNKYFLLIQKMQRLCQPTQNINKKLFNAIQKIRSY